MQRVVFYERRRVVVADCRLPTAVLARMDLVPMEVEMDGDGWSINCCA